MEFLSHYTMQMNRALSALLRLFELEDFARQSSRISQQELIGYQDLPQAISTELEAQLSTIPDLQSTMDALRAGYSLLIRPLLDYDFTSNHKFRLNILLTVPQLPVKNAFCTLESLTPLKYNLSGICFTGPLARDDVALVTCSDERYFIKPAALDKCYTNADTIVCPKSLFFKASRTDWLGVAWTPSTKLPFQRHHRQATDCHNLTPLIHIGARYYLSTTSTTITLFSTKGTREYVPVTPLSVLHVPCNISLDSQATGLAKCPKTISFSLPIFQPTHFSYVPWSPATNDSLFQLHYQSLHLLPPLSFDNKTIADLDDTYHVLDGQLTDQIQEIRKHVKHLQPVSTSTTTDILAFTAFALTLFHCLLFLFLYFYLRRTGMVHLHCTHTPTRPAASCSPAVQTLRETRSL